MDFIIPHDLKILPVEVKSGKSGKMKSLRIFMERKGLDYAVRTSLGNFSLLTLSDSDETPSSPAKSIEIIPIYAVNSLTRPQRIPSPPGNQG